MRESDREYSLEPPWRQPDAPEPLDLRSLYPVKYARGPRFRASRRMTTYSLFLDGEFVNSSGSTRLDVIDPSKSKVIATVPDASAADVDRAVAAARGAFEGQWRRTAPQERGRVLFRIADVIRKSAGDLAQLTSRH